MKSSFLLLPLLLAASCAQRPSATLTVISTGDVHGSYFDQPYVQGGRTKTSLMSVKHFVDSVRVADGAENVLLIDAGDILQGDNAAYYFNYVAADKPHIFPQVASYMGYDVCVLGNHDIETGHPVYDRVSKELARQGIKWLAGNAVKPDGKSYFPTYVILKKAGMKVAVLGFDNANIRAWLSEELWSGMDFVSLVPFVQQCVDRVKQRENPDKLIVAVHSGTGDGDGSQLENQGLDLYDSLVGVDLVIGAHDHAPYAVCDSAKAYVNGGSRAGNVGFVKMDEGGILYCGTVRMDKSAVDTVMREHFRPQFDSVAAFTNRKVGELAMPLLTRDAYTGMCDYINLVHTVQISVPEASISFAAPLTFNGRVKSGELIYNDMFTIYPFENQLFVVRMKGSEIVSYLEYSYDRWIQKPGEHLLRIEQRNDPRTGTQQWSFVGRSYNFDSAAGLVYDVDVTEECGSRIRVRSLADGSPFDPEAWYNVAMTSYRANGGGGIMPQGAGIGSELLESRMVARYPEIREMIYRYISGNPVITPEMVSDKKVTGEWKFVPESLVSSMMAADMALLFPRR